MTKHRPVEAFGGFDRRMIVAAFRAFEAATDGHPVALVGCDDDGEIWLVPSPGCPAAVLREVFDCDWKTTLMIVGEHIP